MFFISHDIILFRLFKINNQYYHILYYFINKYSSNIAWCLIYSIIKSLIDLMYVYKTKLNSFPKFDYFFNKFANNFLIYSKT